MNFIIWSNCKEESHLKVLITLFTFMFPPLLWVVSQTYNGKSDIACLTIVASFFLMIFFTYLKRNGRTQSFTTLSTFINYPILWNIHLHTTLASEPGQTEEIFHISSTHRNFLQCEFMDIFPMKLENQLIINLCHTEKVCSNGDYYIYFNCSGRERMRIHCFFQYPYAPMAYIHCDIKRITNKRFPHCIHRVWLFVHHRHVVCFSPTTFFTLINYLFT